MNNLTNKNHRMLQIALKILDFCATELREVSFKEICDKFQIPKSSAFNLVQTLVSLDYMQKNEANSRFSIGLKTFEIGNAYLAMNPFYTKAKEIVESVSLQCNETTHFAILSETDVVYLYKFDSTQSLRVFSHIGRRVPAHTAAIGKAILSGYDDDEIKRLYSGHPMIALTEHSITSLPVLLEQLDQVRKVGVAFEKEESTPFVQCIGVPIFSKQGKVIAGMSISVPVHRADDKLNDLIELLLEAKKILESLLV